MLGCLFPPACPPSVRDPDIQSGHIHPARILSRLATKTMFLWAVLTQTWKCAHSCAKHRALQNPLTKKATRASVRTSMYLAFAVLIVVIFADTLYHHCAFAYKAWASTLNGQSAQSRPRVTMLFI